MSDRTKHLIRHAEVVDQYSADISRDNVKLRRQNSALYGQIRDLRMAVAPLANIELDAIDVTHLKAIIVKVRQALAAKEAL